jgi:hypothetical protein
MRMYQITKHFRGEHRWQLISVSTEFRTGAESPEHSQRLRWRQHATLLAREDRGDAVSGCLRRPLLLRLELKHNPARLSANQATKVEKICQTVMDVVANPASNWPLFAEKAAELLEKDKVAVVFGCWTSVSRKSVLPISTRGQETTHV